MATDANNRGTRRIPVAAPALIGREREYVLDCLDSTWISSSGYTSSASSKGSPSSVASTCDLLRNGTVALHLALLGLGVGAGDEVIVPTLTYVALRTPSATAVRSRCFVDSEPPTLESRPRAGWRRGHATHQGHRGCAPLRAPGRPRPECWMSRGARRSCSRTPPKHMGPATGAGSSVRSATSRSSASTGTRS